MKRFSLAAGLLLVFGWHSAFAVGFQWASAPDPGNDSLRVAIWYPSPGKVADNLIETYDMDVAMNGAVEPGRHPLIVMSHGTGGSAVNSYDTAIALAQAGFVVAAVVHTGDNYRDQSTSFTRQEFVDRARHISRVIDFVVGPWTGHGSVDPDRIGVFGHSAGGATALIVAGGVADMNKSRAFCMSHADDWACAQARQRGKLSNETIAPVSGPDPRVKAIVVAAPAIALAFQPAGLKAVTVPVQLWVGSEDEIIHDGATIRTLLPRQPDFHVVAHGGHFAYLAPCSEILERAAPEICKDPKGFNRVAFLRGFHQSVIGFYRSALR